jgi:glycosyltransferase involved in cell wall biosynthesis
VARKLVVIVLLKLGAVWVSWVLQIARNLDVLCVPSRFTRDVFAKCGVSPNRIAVVPNGLKVEIFRPDGAAWRPPAARGFTFLL